MLNPKKIQELQKRLAKIQDDLGEETVEASVGGGAVTVVMTGHQKVRSVKIAAEEPLDESWAEPAVFDGCSAKGQARPAAAQPIRIVRAPHSSKGAPP